MVFLNNIMVVGKEDRARADDMPRAILDLQEKHRPTNAALFGKLRYIILMAAAGPDLKVFARRLGSDDPLVPLLTLQVICVC